MGRPWAFLLVNGDCFYRVRFTLGPNIFLGSNRDY